MEGTSGPVEPTAAGERLWPDPIPLVAFPPGVGGAPSGDIDANCAVAGLKTIGAAE